MKSHHSFFQGKIALITGGSSGIGLALARELVAAGATVWIAARRQELLVEAKATIRAQTGRDCHIHSSDVTDAEQVAQLIDAITRQSGTPDLVINSAGITQPGYLHELGLDVYRQLMETNYFGTLNVCMAVLPAMMARHSGHIVNISSGAGFLGVFGYAAYVASKYAVRGFSDVLRVEMKPHGIRVSIAFPPDTDTPQLAYETPYKPPETKAISGQARVLTAQAVADEILAGVQRNRYIILPGSEMKIIYRLNNLLSNGVYPVMDWLVARSKSRKGE